tara:strand:+ start:2164 stop:2271 length:108 start_codon:yes stop_codon:yes gene_type:complete
LAVKAIVSGDVLKNLGSLTNPASLKSYKKVVSMDE